MSFKLSKSGEEVQVDLKCCFIEVRNMEYSQRQHPQCPHSYSIWTILDNYWHAPTRADWVWQTRRTFNSPLHKRLIRWRFALNQLIEFVWKYATLHFEDADPTWWPLRKSVFNLNIQTASGRRPTLTQKQLDCKHRTSEVRSREYHEPSGVFTVRTTAKRITVCR